MSPKVILVAIMQVPLEDHTCLILTVENRVHGNLRKRGVKFQVTLVTEAPMEKKG